MDGTASRSRVQRSELSQRSADVTRERDLNSSNGRFERCWSLRDAAPSSLGRHDRIEVFGWPLRRR
jgi:hypothetical protein